MTYTTSRARYNRHQVTNTETGVTITQWDRVTIGKSKNVWDVSEILWNGDVRLHRQIPAKVGQRGITYRVAQMDRLTVLPENSGAQA